MREISYGRGALATASLSERCRSAGHFAAHPSWQWVPAAAQAGERRHLSPKLPSEHLPASYRYKLSCCNVVLASVALARSPLQGVKQAA